MRLLYFEDDGSLSQKEFRSPVPIPPYAILSHTWGDEEVTLQDLFYGPAKNLKGYQKILFCGNQAAKDGLEYFWVDTCCIDKQNSAELNEAIQSMYRWYGHASKCYAYLSDVSVPISSDMEMDIEIDQSVWMEAFQGSRWFTRGWTLQELIAPKSVNFFSAEGYLLGNKHSLKAKITETTGIPKEALLGQPLATFSPSQRFTWAKGRNTTEKEDIAYCLLGIFDISMSPRYGEGQDKAVRRLKKLVLESRHQHLSGSLEEIEEHFETNPRPRSVLGGTHASKRSLDTDDIEGRKRRRAYLLDMVMTEDALPLESGFRRHGLPQTLGPWHRALFLALDILQDDNAFSIFQKAHFSFLDDVYWDEWPRFKGFTNHVDMMVDILNHCKHATQSTRLLQACKHIDAFCLRWRNFFTLVDVGVDIDPEWSRTLFGGIRLLFVRCIDFVNLFEKFALMFDKMRENLPSYYDLALKVRQVCPEAVKSDFGKALAFVYADVLQFCRDACVLFNKPPGEAGMNVDPTKTLLSTSFTERFSDLLERLSRHQRLFDVDLRAGRHRSLVNFVRNVTKDLEEREQLMQDPQVLQGMEEEKRARDSKFHENIRNLFPPPGFRADFDAARKGRSPGSCAWLLSAPVYISWKAELLKAPSESTAQPRQPILWLEGPPGFGKTILSTAIVEDLSHAMATDPRASGGRPPHGIAYFYFNAQKPSKQRYGDSLRATAIQVIETLGNDPLTIDLLSITTDCDDDRQSLPSEDELMELLLLSIRRFSSLVFILDGVDECLDFERIWPFLSRACEDERVKCLVLGRPEVRIPEKYVSLLVRQSLQGMNRQDIWNYLYQETQNLQMAGKLQAHLIPDSVADTLTTHAQSRFLWASLILAYLQSPGLSLVQRTQQLEDPSRLETLHGLYSGLLGQFESLPSETRRLVTKIFQFLVLAKELPSITQLSIAVSDNPIRTVAADQLSKVAQTLRKFCGQLVYIDPDSIVSFSHLSFRVFLQSEETMQLKTPFRVDFKSGSLRIAVACLSYLSTDVPDGPLSGSPDTVADKAIVASQLPLLEYSARYWVDHAVGSLKLTTGAQDAHILDCYSLFQHLGPFISQKTAISSWIEVCWTYGIEPSVEALWEELQGRLAPAEKGAQDPTAWRILKTLDQIRILSEDLKNLNRHWRRLLSVRPYEIWSPSISAFLGQSSWEYNDECKVTTIAPDESDEDFDRTIFQVHKLSACRNFCATVKILRPSSAQGSTKPVKPCSCGLKECICSHDTSPVDLRGAVASYQILELKPGFPIAKRFLIDLNAEDLLEVEKAADGNKFRLPVAFSPNLRCFSILRTVFWLEYDGSLQQQRIDVSMAQPVQPEVSDRNGKRHQESRLKSSFYKLKFSPGGHFLAIVERQSDQNEFSRGHWDFRIWRKKPRDPSAPQASGWQQVTELCNIYGDFLPEGSFAFHPEDQMIAFLEYGYAPCNQTSIWHFGSSTQGISTRRMVYGTGLLNLHFSLPHGNFLLGYHFHYKTGRMVSLERYRKDSVPVPPPDQETANDPEMSDIEMDTDPGTGPPSAAHAGSTQLLLAREHQHTLPSSDTLTLGGSNGVPELSTIRTYGDGAVVLKRLSSLVDAETCLIYLPDFNGANTSVSILDGGDGGQDTVRMVLTTDFEDSYTWDNPLNRQPATIITRPIQSIQQYKLPNGRHRIWYDAGELPGIPNDGARELLTLEDRG